MRSVTPFSAWTLPDENLTGKNAFTQTEQLISLLKLAFEGVRKKWKIFISIKGEVEVVSSSKPIRGRGNWTCETTTQGSCLKIHDR
jgi:hypothetical protein